MQQYKISSAAPPGSNPFHTFFAVKRTEEGKVSRLVNETLFQTLCGHGFWWEVFRIISNII